MPLPLESKLPQISTTIFTVMSRLAQTHQAINLSQGFPDFPCDNHLLDEVNDAMRAGHNQYAPMMGLPVLRNEIAQLIEEKYGAKFDPETEVTVTSGATEALFCAIMSLVREGDEVIVIEPAYDSYIPAIELAGANPVCVSLEYPSYQLNWESVRRLVNRNTRAIILNTPNNPSGSILTQEDISQLEKLVSQNNIFIISDEVYEHIIFDGNRHESIARYPNLIDRTLIVSSFGKTFHTTGWKVGYCAGPEYMMREFRKMHQFITFSTATPIQMGIANYMRNRKNINELAAFYQQKRDTFLHLMKNTGFQPLPCAGTYFQLMSYSDISDEKDTDFVIRLTQEFGVAAIPVSAFYRNGEDNKVIRFCFAKQEDTLREAAKRLEKVV
jgi:methionine aminotransferase